MCFFSKKVEKNGWKNVYKGMNDSVYPVLGLWRRRIAAFLALCAVFSACMYAEEGDDGAGLRVSFLDVGQGLAVLLEEGGRYALYDTGPDSAGLVDTLTARGVRELEWVLVSHAHRDHGGGFMEFARAVESGALRVGRLYVGPDTYAGIVRDSVLRLASRLKVPVDTVARGSVLGMRGSFDAPSGGAPVPPRPVRLFRDWTCSGRRRGRGSPRTRRAWSCFSSMPVTACC